MKTSTHARLCSLFFAALVSLGASTSLAAPPDGARDAPLEKDEDAHDHARFGAIAGVGFPHPLSVEALVKIEDWAAVGLEYGVLPKMNIGGVDVKLDSIAGDVRVFPFRGAFFVGVRGGYQSASASTTLTVAPIGAMTQHVDIGSWYVNPRIGILWTSRPGFSIGTELGVQIPVSTTTSTNVPALVASATNLTSTAQMLGSTPIPTVDLIRLGFLY